MLNYFNKNHQTDDSDFVKDINRFLLDYDLRWDLQPGPQDVWDWIMEVQIPDAVNLSDCYADLLLANLVGYLCDKSGVDIDDFEYNVFGEYVPYLIYKPMTNKGVDDISTYEDLEDLFETLEILPNKR